VALCNAFLGDRGAANTRFARRLRWCRGDVPASRRGYDHASAPGLRKIFRFVICHLAHIPAMCDCSIPNY